MDKATEIEELIRERITLRYMEKCRYPFDLSTMLYLNVGQQINLSQNRITRFVTDWQNVSSLEFIKALGEYIGESPLKLVTNYGIGEKQITLVEINELKHNEKTAA